MALSKATASDHNLKRAETFKKFGVSDWDAKYAHPQFLGKDNTPEGGTCTLCGQQHLLWLFAIKFDAPDLTVAIAAITKGITRTAEVVFNPVGSVCISDWMDALPESVEKLELLKRWKIEMAKEKDAKNEQAIGNALVKAGLETTEKAIERFNAAQAKLKANHALPSFHATEKCPIDWYERRALAKIGYKAASPHRHTLKRKWGSAKAVSLFANALKKIETWTPGTTPVTVEKDEMQLEAEMEGAAVGAAEATSSSIEPDGSLPAPLTPEQIAALALAKAKATEIQQLLDRGTEVLGSKEKLDRLNSYEQGAVKDICRKVKSYGSFASESQKGFLLKLLAKAEASKVAIDAAKEAAKAAAKPVIDAGLAVLADPTKLGALNGWEQGTLKDIAAKVEKYGTFASSSQQKLFERITAKGEKGTEAVKPTAVGAEDAETEVMGPLPGAEGFVSASGLAGAKY